MYKVIDEWKIGVRDFIVLTLNKRLPDEFGGKVRIAGKEYAVSLTYYSGAVSEDILDAMLRNIVVNTSDVGFIGKEVELV